MSQEPVKNLSPAARKVVFSPLDWGLGHTTRSIPLLKILENLGFSIVIACNSTQFKILRPHFPGSRFVPLEGYSISFGKSRAGTLFRILRQAPKILTRIKEENRWLKEFCLAEKPDLVLSDSRFGFWFTGCPSIIVTHQLQIRTGLGPFVNAFVNRYNRNWLGHFNRIWIAAHADPATALSGNLSRVSSLQVPVDHLGLLSRFTPCTSSPNRSGKTVSVILSGPEPQRSQLENKIIRQAIQLQQPLTLVRGLPAAAAGLALPSFITCFNHLDTSALEQLLCNSSFVISRPGYSSLMDYAATGTKSILIPTPGQAEQEYLAVRCQEQHWAVSVTQEAFDLKAALQAAAAFRFEPFPQNSQPLEKTVRESLQSLGVLP